MGAGLVEEAEVARQALLQLLLGLAEAHALLQLLPGPGPRVATGDGAGTPSSRPASGDAEQRVCHRANPVVGGSHVLFHL